MQRRLVDASSRGRSSPYRPSAVQRFAAKTGKEVRGRGGCLGVMALGWCRSRNNPGSLGHLWGHARTVLSVLAGRWRAKVAPWGGRCRRTSSPSRRVAVRSMYTAVPQQQGVKIFIGLASPSPNQPGSTEPLESDGTQSDGVRQATFRKSIPCGIVWEPPPAVNTQIDKHGNRPDAPSMSPGFKLCTVRALRSIRFSPCSGPASRPTLAGIRFQIATEHRTVAWPCSSPFPR